jgi:hypothetical protein
LPSVAELFAGLGAVFAMGGSDSFTAHIATCEQEIRPRYEFLQLSGQTPQQRFCASLMPT